MPAIYAIFNGRSHMTSPTRCDVLVVGAGLAGLAAANRAAQFGLRVAVLEQGSAKAYLCNSRMTGGMFHVARKNMRDDPRELRERMEAATCGYANGELVDAVAADSLRTLDWLSELGVRFIRPTIGGVVKNALAPPSVRRPGPNNWPGRAGDVMLSTLEARLVSRGGSLMRGTRARELVMRDGSCIGVIADQNGSAQQFECAAVVIADGGFQNAPDLVAQYISPAPQRVMRRNAGTGLGDGMRMAQAVGARLTGMNRFYGHLLYAGAMESDSFWPYPTIDFLAEASVVVNGQAQRFVDEGYGGTHIANAIAALEDPLSASVIFDASIWEGPGRKNELPPNPFVTDGGGKLIQAPTLNALAAALALPAETLKRTVNSYNESVDRSESLKLDPPRSVHLVKAWPVGKAPFMAMRLCAGLTYTMGGICTDKDGRVLAEDGSPIAGLFAAGSCTGGLEGGEFSGYTGGLSKAAVFGMRAGEFIGQRMKDGSLTTVD
jgi:fumarate reductase flavoprotein subunit